MTIDLRKPALPESTVRTALALLPHPEGGHYREVWRDRPQTDTRGAASSILFLLAAGERSHWHRVDAAELWLWQAGAPLSLNIVEPDAPTTEHRLGPNLGAGERLQAVVPPHAWQAAASLGDWTLVSCIVAPAFDFAGFELAPPTWTPTSPPAGSTA